MMARGSAQSQKNCDKALFLRLIEGSICVILILRNHFTMTNGCGENKFVQCEKDFEKNVKEALKCLK
jgi:hypothetical protein